MGTGTAWKLGRRCRNILARALSELPASHGLRLVGNLQQVLLRWVEMVDGRGEQVLNETRLVPILAILGSHFESLDDVVIL